MRILVLADSLADIEGDVPLEAPDGNVNACAARDVQIVLPTLDRSRVQPEVYALRGPEHSLGAKDNAIGLPDIAALRRLLRLIREHDIELVHSVGGRSHPYVALAGLITGVPTLASSYKTVPNFSRRYQIRTRPMQQFFRLGIRRVVVPSALAKKAFEDMHYPPGHVQVIYPGMRWPGSSGATRAALGLPDGPLATMVAPITVNQGYDILLDAVPRLINRLPTAHVAVLGTGPLDAEMRAESAAIRPPIPLTWLDPDVNRADVIEASDVIIVHPRQVGGIPQGLVEAFLAGKPVVGSRLAGINEFIEPQITGIMVTPGDSRDLAVQIGRLLLQPNFARHMGEAAQKRAHGYLSLDAQRDALTTLYEATIYSTR